MNLKYILLTILFFTLSIQESFSQKKGTPDLSQTRCKHTDVQRDFISLYPEAWEEVQAQVEAGAKQYATSGYEKNGDCADIITVPVVIHYIYNASNLNDGYDNDSYVLNTIMAGLNTYFQRENNADDNLPPAFQNTAANGTCIEWCLAQYDHPTNAALHGNDINRNGIKDANGDGRIDEGQYAINRYTATSTQITNIANAGADQNTNQMSLIQSIAPAWSTNQYLNIYIVPDLLPQSGGFTTAGYTFLPNNGGSLYNSIYIGYDFATNGSTIAHECGHWLGLNHVWENSSSEGCGAEDYFLSNPSYPITDTYPQDSSSIYVGGSTCNATSNSQVPQSCGSVDNIFNLMDYGNCTFYFTDRQAHYMYLALTSLSTGGRSNFGNDLNLTKCQADLPTASFVPNSGSFDFCIGQTLYFINTSIDATSWLWTFSGSALNGVQTSTDEEAFVTPDQSGILTVSLTATNADGSDTAGPFNIQLTALPEGCTDPDACNYDSMAQCDDGSCLPSGGCTDPTACNYDNTALCDNGSCILPDGCTDPSACNYDNMAQCDDGSCLYVVGCTDPTACNYDNMAQCDDGSCILPDGCTDINACNFDNTAQCNDGSCDYNCLGCTDNCAPNYDPNATVDDGSCEPQVFGCTNPSACNYDNNAVCDDGNCLLPNGCTDPIACNYSPSATCNDGSCFYPTGCTDPAACNYDPTSFCNDNSCAYTADASFMTLNASYCSNQGTINLNPNMSIGTFSGPGVSGNTFTPSLVPSNLWGTTITITYTINQGSCSDVSSQTTIVDFCNAGSTTLNLKICLEGGYDAMTNLMRTDLRQQNLLPLSQPYNVAPWNYTGTESVANAAAFPADAVDWVLVEMRTGTPSNNGTPTTTLIESKAGIVLANGNVVEADGSSFIFNSLNNGTAYHILVRHRNHIGVISQTPVTAASTMNYDFTSNMNQAFSYQQMKEVGSNVFAMFAGDFLKDGTVQVSDYDSWKLEPALLQVYNNHDGNLDGTVQTTDSDVWFVNKAKLAPVEVVP